MEISAITFLAFIPGFFIFFVDLTEYLGRIHSFPVSPFMGKYLDSDYRE
jgi:hypothetical protein